MWVIKDWRKHFETAESAKVKNLTWVRFPNGHGGRGYRRLMRKGERGLLAYACFNLMVQVASSSRMETRGILASTEGPLTALDLEDITDVTAQTFENAFVILASAEIGWIEWKDADSVNLTDSRQTGFSPDEMGFRPVETDIGPVKSSFPDVSLEQDRAKHGFDRSNGKKPLIEERRGEERRREEKQITKPAAAAAVGVASSIQPEPTAAAALSPEEWAEPDRQKLAFDLARELAPKHWFQSSIPLAETALQKVLAPAVNPAAVVAAIRRKHEIERGKPQGRNTAKQQFCYWLADGYYLHDPAPIADPVDQRLAAALAAEAREAEEERRLNQ